MSETSVTLSCLGSARINSQAPSVNEHGAASYDALITPAKNPDVLLRFAAPDASYAYKKLVNAQLRVYYSTSNSGLAIVSKALNADFDPDTVTYATWPGSNSRWKGTTDAPKSGSSVYLPSEIDSEGWSASYQAKYALATRAFAVHASGGIGEDYPDSAICLIYTDAATAAKRPTLTIVVDPAVTITSKAYGYDKTSGYVNPHEAQTFRWGFMSSTSYQCAADWTQASATFYWSSDNGSTWNSVAASGSTQSVTIPANTFPAGAIQWKVTATDNQGTTSTSSVYTINTADTLPTTTLLSPIDTLEAANSEITFRWTSANASGSAPNGYQLCWRDASVTPASWNYVYNIPGNQPYYVMPANTLPSGTVIWTVATKNIDNAYGPWATQAQIRTVGAPAAPVVSVTAVPFATIEWQAVGQQAWRVTVDGTVYGPYFGGTKTFTLPDYLADGEHTASVEVQGQYGLWSQAGTADFTVANVPGDDVTLKAVCYRDAELSWTSDSTTEDWLVYRDGVRIGHTAQRGFTDRRSIGSHSWQVVNRLAGGYYTASNTVRGELRSCTPALVPLTGGEWLDLRKSDSQTREDIWQGSRTASVRHFAGEEYPTAEFSAFKDETVSLSVAWLPEEADEARRFESLIGKIVIYKNKDRMMVGVLQGFNLRRPQFYRSYSVTLTRVHWRDFVDEDP